MAKEKLNVLDMAKSQWYHLRGSPTPDQLFSAAVNGVAFFGTVFFGWLGDKLGRKKVYGMTLLLLLAASAAILPHSEALGYKDIEPAGNRENRLEGSPPLRDHEYAATPIVPVVTRSPAVPTPEYQKDSADEPSPDWDDIVSGILVGLLAVAVMIPIGLVVLVCYLCYVDGGPLYRYLFGIRGVMPEELAEVAMVELGHHAG